MTTYRKRVTSVFLIIIAIFCFSTVVFGAYRTGTSEEILKSAERLSSYYEKLALKIFLFPIYQFSDEKALTFDEIKNAGEIVVVFAIDTNKLKNFYYFTVDIDYSDENNETLALPQITSSNPYFIIPNELIGTELNFTVKFRNGSEEMKYQKFKGVVTNSSTYNGNGEEIYYPHFEIKNQFISAPLSYYYNPETDDWQTSPYKPQSPFEDPSSTTASKPSPVIKNCGNRG